MRSRVHERGPKEELVTEEAFAELEEAMKGGEEIATVRGPGPSVPPGEGHPLGPPRERRGAS